jgi:hypothetical protein
LCSPSRTFQHFMEPEGSIPCSQEPSIDPYPEPYPSNQLHAISLISILILSAHLHPGLPSGLFHSGFPTNILYAFLFSPHSCYMACPSQKNRQHVRSEDMRRACNMQQITNGGGITELLGHFEVTRFINI